MKLNLGQYSEAKIGQDFNFRFSRDADVWLRFCFDDVNNLETLGLMKKEANCAILSVKYFCC